MERVDKPISPRRNKRAILLIIVTHHRKLLVTGRCSTLAHTKYAPDTTSILYAKNVIFIFLLIFHTLSCCVVISHLVVVIEL